MREVGVGVVDSDRGRLCRPCAEGRKGHCSVHGGADAVVQGPETPPQKVRLQGKCTALTCQIAAPVVLRECLIFIMGFELR